LLARQTRPRQNLAKLMSNLKAGDVVTVTKLERLGRLTRELLDLTECICKAGAVFRARRCPRSQRAMRCAPKKSHHNSNFRGYMDAVAKRVGLPQQAVSQ
jgi:hypothetical protein